jgi:hypothetical protein
MKANILQFKRGWDKTKKGPFNAEHDQYRILIPLMISVQPLETMKFECSLNECKTRIICFFVGK